MLSIFEFNHLSKTAQTHAKRPIQQYKNIVSREKHIIKTVHTTQTKSMLEASTTISLILGIILGLYTLLFIVRIVMTWYPQVETTKFPFNLAVFPTEPALAITRKIVPPIGGVDITPIIWVAIAAFLREILLGQQGLIRMLARQ
jgi:YggT family protein